MFCSSGFNMSDKKFRWFYMQFLQLFFNLPELFIQRLLRQWYWSGAQDSSSSITKYLNLKNQILKRRTCLQGQSFYTCIFNSNRLFNYQMIAYSLTPHKILGFRSSFRTFLELCNKFLISLSIRYICDYRTACYHRSQTGRKRCNYR